jgi:hypothetical protein
MKLIFLTLILSISLAEFSQPNKKMNRDSCRYQLNTLGYFWKIDSLGSNGLRLYVVDRLLSCNLNDITEEELFNNLGKPNIVRPLNAGIEFIAYI